MSKRVIYPSWKTVSLCYSYPLRELLYSAVSMYIKLWCVWKGIRRAYQICRHHQSNYTVDLNIRNSHRWWCIFSESSWSDKIFSQKKIMVVTRNVFYARIPIFCRLANEERQFLRIFATVPPSVNAPQNWFIGKCFAMRMRNTIIVISRVLEVVSY